jgi:hypothetical protein
MPLAAIEPFYSSWVALGGLSIVVVCALAAIGDVALRLVPVLRVAHDAPARHAESLLVGLLVFSVLGFVGVLARVPLVATFAGCVAVAALLGLALRRKAVAVLPRGESAPAGAAWGALGLIVAGSLIWSVTNLRGLEASGETVRLVPWVDVLFHARQISNFAHFQGDAGALHWSMYGEPMAAYHYGSYVVSALIGALGDASAIQLATSVYPVFGMVVSGAAMLVLAQSTLGWRAALVALALLYFLPDLSSWVPRLTRQGSYFFFQQVGVGGAYATGVLGLALACALRARATGVRLLSVWALGLLLASALFKVQIVLAYGAVFALVVIALAPGLDRRLRALGFAAVIGLTVAGMAVLAGLPNAPTVSVSLDGVRKLFHLGAPGDVPIVAQLALLPVGAVGVWGLTCGVLLPLALWLAWKHRAEPALRAPIALLLAFLLAHAAVRLLIDDNRGYGDHGEVNRKTFVLPYFVVVYAVAALAWHHVQAWPREHPLRRRPVWQAAGALMVVASSLAAWRLQVWPGKSERFTGVEVPVQLLASAVHLRRTTAPSAVVQLCENDPLLTLATLAERPIYVARFVINPINTPPPNRAERERLARLEAIDHAPDFDRALRLARDTSIDWFVLTPQCRPLWEASAATVRADGGYRVIAFQHAAAR